MPGPNPDWDPETYERMKQVKRNLSAKAGRDLEWAPLLAYALFEIDRLGRVPKKGEA